MKQSPRQNKTLELVAFYLYPFFCLALSHLLKLNSFGSVIIFFTIPALYLSYKCRKKSIIRQAQFFSVATGLPFIIVIDCLANINQQWIVPGSILPFRFYTYVALEVILWAVFNIYFVILFYEYFIDNGVKKYWSKRVIAFTASVFLFFIVFTILYYTAPHFFKIPYFYLGWGTVLLLIPTIIRLLTNPQLLFDYLKVGLYFFVLTFVYEIAALQLDWWDFPGTNFIGWVSVIGVRFPLEELIFWVILFSMAVLAHYEFFFEKSDQ